MRILFVVSELGYIDPIGIAFLSAVAKMDGHKTFFCSLDRDNFCGKIETTAPNIVAYSAHSCSIDRISKANEVARAKSSFVSIIGGPHATFCPEETLARGFDACCIGEGEYTFKDFLARIDANEPYDDVKGLITLNQKKVTVRRLIENLDELPFPDRDLVLSNTMIGNTSKKAFFSSRGCPFQCTYCLNPAFKLMYKGKGRYVRRFSVDRLIDEIQYVRSRYRLDFVKFDDDIFAIKEDIWLEEFSKKYSEKVKLPFNCLVRLDHINDNILELLKQAGCYSITTSVDSVSEQVREEVLDRRMSNELLVRNLRKIRSYDIRTFVNFILGLPKATIEDELQSIDIAKQSNATYVNYTFLVPFPGTTIWKYCRDNKYISPDYQIPPRLYEEPTLNSSEKQKRIQKNVFCLGQITKNTDSISRWFFMFLIKCFPNIRLFRFVKRYVHKHYMEKEIYKISDDVVLASDM